MLSLPFQPSTISTPITILMGFFNSLTATAVSFVVGGNTGVSPCLSLFLVGIVERCNPDLLNMSGIVETILASWPGIILLGCATIVEFVSMCVPVLDEIVDSIMIFVIPVMSVLGTMSTFGLFTMPDFDSIEVNGNSEGGRQLTSATSGALIFFQIVIIFVGIGLALSMHMVKMMVRLIGQGWLTNVLTVIEATWCIITIILAIFIRPVAMFIAACILIAGAYNIKRRLVDRNKTSTSLEMSHAPERPTDMHAARDVEHGDYNQM